MFKQEDLSLSLKNCNENEENYVLNAIVRGIEAKSDGYY